MTAALNAATGSTIAPGVNIPIGAVDIGIHNVIGVEASALGNHEFDLGSRVLRNSLAPNLGAAGYVGANFVSISANLVVGPSSPYFTNPTATDADLNQIYTDTIAGDPTFIVEMLAVSPPPRSATAGDPRTGGANSRSGITRGGGVSPTGATGCSGGRTCGSEMVTASLAPDEGGDWVVSASMICRRM